MILPPNLTPLSVALTSSGVANTVTTGTLLAAPGAGFRTRLWGFGAHPTNTAQAVVNWRCMATDGVAGVFVAQASGANFAAAEPYWVPGGVVIATNAILGFSLQSALVSLAIAAIIYYTNEAV